MASLITPMAVPVGGIVVPVIISLLSRYLSFGAASCLVLANVGRVVQVWIGATGEE